MGRWSRRLPWGFAVLLVVLMVAPAFAAVSVSVDGEKQGVYENLNLLGLSATRSGNKVDIMLGNYESVTTSAANPGVAAASLATLVTGVTTDNTGASADVLTLADGTEGQMKIVTLKSSFETSGLAVTPTHILGATTDVLLSATGDAVTFVFDGTSWNIVTTNGTRQ